jgi:hypothetical protein
MKSLLSRIGESGRMIIGLVLLSSVFLISGVVLFSPMDQAEAGCNAPDGTYFEIASVTLTSSPADYACVGDTVTFTCTVTTSPVGYEGDLSCSWPAGFSVGAGGFTATKVFTSPSSPGPETVTVMVSGTPWPGETCEASASDTITIIKVDSVEWVAVDSPLDTNPNTGGGKRIYSGKQTPTDTTNRKKVKARATITPAIAGQTVYFKVFDVDDPWTDASPIDSNGADGTDNRGSAGSLSAGTATTDASGIAEVEFTVSLQPGDNFRVGACCCSDLSSVADNDVPANNTPTIAGQPGTYSEMLTVWRKVWVERDSMEPIPSSKRRAIGWVDKATVGIVNDYTFEADFVSWADGVHPDEHEYEGGPLKFILYDSSGGTTYLSGFTVMKNDNNFFANNEIVIKPALTASQKAAIAAATTVKFEMSDDDDYTVFDSPHYPDGGSVLTTALKDAYVFPEDATTYNTTPLHPAVAHVSISQYWTGMTSTRDLSSASDFWAAYVLACFEPWDGITLGFGHLGDDYDPDGMFSPPSPPPSSSYFDPGSDSSMLLGISKTPPGPNCALIFLEVIRENSYLTFSGREQHVVTHELGHTAGPAPFGLWHKDPGGKIMQTAPSNFFSHEHFCDDHIDKLRSMTKW